MEKERERESKRWTGVRERKVTEREGGREGREPLMSPFVIQSHLV